MAYAYVLQFEPKLFNTMAFIDTVSISALYLIKSVYVYVGG